MSDRKQVLEEIDKQDHFWKERAADGIERYRKGDAKLTLTDADGNPISNATVRIKQKTHEFRFGANIFMLDELETEEKNEKYKKYFSDIFNMATLPFYWDALEPERDKPRYAKDSPKVKCVFSKQHHQKKHSLPNILFLCKERRLYKGLL